MPSQIRFFEKNKADYSLPNVVATASNGSSFAKFALNRNNISAWVTNDSTDSENTTLQITWGDFKTIDTMLLVKHNFKSYKVEYLTGVSTWTSIVDVTGNALETTFHQFTPVTTQSIKLTVRGTMVADEDKFLFQLIATEEIGQLNAWPIIKKPKVSRSRQKTTMLSGKQSIKEQVGSFSCNLSVKILRDSQDIALIESLYLANEGFLVWLCGGDEAQFATGAIGYRLEDIYLMKCADEYEPELEGGFYWAGEKVSIDLVEVID